MGEVEKNSFIVLPGKGGHSGFLLRKTPCPNPGGFDEEFYSNSSSMGLLTRLECVQGLHPSSLVSGNVLMSFSGSSNLASGGFLAAPPLFSNCSNLPFGTQGRLWTLESAPYKQEMGHRKVSVPRSPTGSCSVSKGGILERSQCPSNIHTQRVQHKGRVGLSQGHVGLRPEP